ncbi:hypothetical protein [Thauera propionica]|uniref:hypothetical protein n=1 Tax=Thauera propionica TaxID=2019431 RepID=UPI0023F53BD1|nr:hypothetical protein [Thauera propionica]MDD3674982.1 hypothetical protein [Thauera propionica]
MTTTLTNGATVLELDEDLYWSDEAWSPVVQATEHSITGALIVDEGVKQGGRPITLEPEDDRSGQMPRAVLDQLRAWAADPGLVMTLMLRGQSYLVRFRHSDGPITARPMVHFSDVAAADLYFITLRFIEI